MKLCLTLWFKILSFSEGTQCGGDGAGAGAQEPTRGRHRLCNRPCICSNGRWNINPVTQRVDNCRSEKKSRLKIQLLKTNLLDAMADGEVEEEVFFF